MSNTFMGKILDWFKRKWLITIISITVVSLIVFVVRSAFKIHNKITKSANTDLECDSVKTRVLNIVLTILIIYITIASLPKYIEKIYNKYNEYVKLKNPLPKIASAVEESEEGFKKKMKHKLDYLKSKFDKKSEKIPEEEVSEDISKEEIPEEVSEDISKEEIPEEVSEDISKEEVSEEIPEEVSEEEIPEDISKEEESE